MKNETLGLVLERMKGLTFSQEDIEAILNFCKVRRENEYDAKVAKEHNKKKNLHDLCKELPDLFFWHHKIGKCQQEIFYLSEKLEKCGLNETIRGSLLRNDIMDIKDRLYDISMEMNICNGKKYIAD